MTGPRCRYCRGADGTVVLDLGAQPACDDFPAAGDLGPDLVHPLRMWLCSACGLAQLAEDPTDTAEPRGVEPRALADQARDAVERVASAGLLPAGGTVTEFGSPHGGSWLDLLASKGLRVTDGPADVVVDCFGMMHEADQAVGLAARLAALDADGVLLLQFHSLASILAGRQWNALRHGHFAYYSTPVLVRMLREAGLTPRTAFTFDLYGGTVLLAATRGGQPDAAVSALLAGERAAGVTDPVVLGGLRDAAVHSATAVRAWLCERAAAGERVLGYGAASRAVALLCGAGVDATLLPAIADASTAKQGRRMPGSAIPIVSPDELVAADPDAVLLMLPDLIDEVRRALPSVRGWVLADADLRAGSAAR